MEQKAIQQPRVVIAPEPGRKVVRALFLSFGVVLGSFLSLSILSFFLPEPLRAELVWDQFHSNLFVLTSFFPFIIFFFPYVYIVPFINIPVLTSYKQWKWRIFEKKRRQAVENSLSDEETTIIPLAEIYNPLPDSVSIHLRRNWRATLISGAIYIPLIGYVFLVFIFDWHSNMQYLAQQGEISGWALFGGITTTLFYCLFLVPALSAFIFASRQRLIATQDGLTCYRGLSFSFIPWSEAQLFAVLAQQKDTLVYELSSSTSLIRWSTSPRGNYGDTFPAATVGTAPLGLVRAEGSTEEYQWQILQLIAMVAAKTNLPLYDLR